MVETSSSGTIDRREASQKSEVKELQAKMGELVVEHGAVMQGGGGKQSAGTEPTDSSRSAAVR
jgi:hypothetical protein